MNCGGNSMRKLVISAFLTTLFTAGLMAQKSGAWSDWSRKDAEKILNDSPWGQTQVETNTSEMTYSPTTGAAPGTGATTRPSTGIREDQTDRNRNRAREGA